METGIVASTGQAANGSLSSVGSSLAHVGTATKALVLTHPVGLAAAGGVILGVGVYYAAGKLLKKKEAIVETPSVA